MYTQLKQASAKHAMKIIESLLHKDMIIGVGSGSTVNFFIEELAKHRNKFRGTVASSNESIALLSRFNIEVFDLNTIDGYEYYIDGADEINQKLQMIKGGGGAHTREKLVASLAENFICITDISKIVPVLGKAGVPVEVLKEARSYVSRQLIKLGGIPEYRHGFITDNNNIILDIKNIHIEAEKALDLEYQINNIAGVIANGIFAVNKATMLVCAKHEQDNIEIIVTGELQ